MSKTSPSELGPFRADQIRSGDPYELSRGHAIQCMTTGGRGSRVNLTGGSVLDTDPAVEEAGVDTGYSPSPDMLRAPDVAVGNVPDAPGWVAGAPPLAVEYADTGQDDGELRAKITDLLGAGTRIVWVVHLVGPRRVEIHGPDREMELAYPGDELRAPGILQNPVPVEALFDREAAHEVTLRNLLQRRGYRDLDAVRDEGLAEGRQEGRATGREEGREEGRLGALKNAIADVLEARGLELSDASRQVLEADADEETLRLWLTRAATAGSAHDVFEA